MVLNEISHHKTTEVKLNEEMMLAIMHAIGFADDQSIPGGGVYCHIWAIWVCAAVKGMVFKQFTLG